MLWVLIGGGVAVVVALVAGASLILWTSGAFSTSGGELDWSVVAAIAGVVGALTSIATAAALGLAAVQFDRQSASREAEQERDRVAHFPYVRVDIGFGDHLRQPGFRPPQARHVYELATLGNYAVLLADLAEITDEAAGHPLVLWATNIQSAAIGIADSVGVRIKLAWQTYSAASPVVREFDVAFSYLEPGRTTAVRLCSVRGDIYEFLARVEDVRYYDIFGNDSRDTHGAMALVYAEGEVSNERKVRRTTFLEDGSREGDDGHVGPEGRRD